MSTCPVSKILVILLACFGTFIIKNAVTPEEPPYKVYPLMLHLTSDHHLQQPTELKVSDGIFFAYKKYEFTAPESKEELVFCPVKKVDKVRNESGKNEIATVEGGDYCNVEVKEFFVFYFIKLLKLRMDVRRCEKESEPFISKIFSDTDTIQEGDNHNLEMIRCGPGDSGKLYRYGYEILLTNKEVLKKVKNNLHANPSLTTSKVRVHPNGSIIDYEMYRFCYDEKNKKVIHTQHRLISPLLLQNRHLWREKRKHYETSSNNFGLEELNFEERKKKYEKYLKKKREKTSSEESDEQPKTPEHEKLPYETEQLVPAEDFALALWMKPTHHYLNVELMNEKLSKLWNGIVEKIQNYARKNQLELDVYTKTFNIPKKSDENERNFEIVLEEGNPEMILKPPQIWIKIVHHSSKSIGGNTIGKSVAIIANNHMNNELNPFIDEYCKIDYCRNFQSEKYSDEYKYVRCCLINEKIEELFNLNPKLVIGGSGIEGLMYIEELINPTDITSDEEKNTETET